MEEKLSYRADVDGLRAIAILSVVFFHYFPTLLQGGFVGVDIFFVISGYLITSIILKEINNDVFSFMDFYGKRVRRIFPALLLVLVFCFAYGWNELLAEDYKLLGKHIASSTVFITNFVLYNETGYFDTVSELKPLLHLWSLGVEEQFYVFWPLLLWILHKRKSLYVKLIGLIFLSSFVTNLFLANTNQSADFYLPFSRFWELMSGAVIANFESTTERKYSFSKKINNFQSILGFLFLLFSIFYLNNKLTYPSYFALLPVFGAFLIINARQNSIINKNLLSTKPLVYIGLISYPLYLWHWPLLSFYKLANGDDITLLGKIKLLILSFVLASLTYHLVEKKFRNRTNFNMKVFGLIGLMCLVGYIGFNDYIRDGLDFRVKHIISNFVDTKFNLKTSWREHECFLLDNDSQFSSDCISKGNGKLIVVYGDSFAASLSPGLSVYLKESGLRFGQFTTSGCPPMLANSSQANRCKKANESAISMIKSIKPHGVILESNWNSDSIKELPKLINLLLDYGVKKIEIVGILPKWQGSLPRVYFRYYKKFHSPLPIYTTFGLAKNNLNDSDIEAIANKNHILFFSAYKLLCSNSGCLTRVNGTNKNEKGKITTLDDAHLTPSASEYLAKKLITNFTNF